MRTPKELPHLTLLAALWVGALWNRESLPEALPVHWNLDLLPDATGTRNQALFVLPVVGTLLWALMRFVPALMGAHAEIAAAQPAYDRMRLVVLAFVAALFGLIRLHYAQLVPSLSPGFPLLLGLLLVGLGLIMPGLPPNRFAGVRLPWTLRDPEVWARTHRVAGAGFVVSGAALGATSLVSPRLALPLGLGGLTVVLVVVTIYAARIARR
jgi:uncharacterized membrane protein